MGATIWKVMCMRKPATGSMLARQCRRSAALQDVHLERRFPMRLQGRGMRVQRVGANESASQGRLGREAAGRPAIHGDDERHVHGFHGKRGHAAGKLQAPRKNDEIQFFFFFFNING